MSDILPEEVIGDFSEKLRGLPSRPTPDPSTLGGPPTPLVGETLSKSLDDAANTIISLFTPSLKEYFIELSDMVLKIPRWQLVLGSVMAQYESGTLAAPSLDPSWRQVEAIIGMSTCHYDGCKKEFIPVRVGQVFCSKMCGDADRKEKADILHAKQKAEDEKKARLIQRRRVNVAEGVEDEDD